MIIGSLEDLKTERANLADEVKALADRQDSWNAKDRLNWDRLNKKYDEIVDAVKSKEIAVAAALRNRAAIDKELAELGDNFTQADVNRVIDRNGGGRCTGEIPSDDSNQVAHGNGNGRGLQLRDASTGREFRALSHDQSFCHDSQLNVGRVICDLVLGRKISNQQIGGGDASGGYLLSPELSTRVIDLARSASVVLKAGAQTVGMTTSELHLAKLSSDATATWRPEGVTVPASDVQFERLTLRARTLACVVPISIELAEDAQNASQVVETALRNSMGLAVDRAILQGTGTTEPQGILQNPDAQSISAIGKPTNRDHVLDAIGDIENADFNGSVSDLSFISHPRDLTILRKLKDSNLNPQGIEPSFADIQKFSTTTLPATDGTGSDESSAVLGAFQSVLIGMRTSAVQIRILDSGTVSDSAGNSYNAASQLLKLIVAFLRVDAVLLQPTWFVKLSGIKIA